MTSIRCASALLVFMMIACSEPPPPAQDAGSTDAGVHTADGGSDAGVQCTRDRDCDDARYCNGGERCMPGAPAADAMGCVAGDPPCDTGTVCDESADRCDSCTPDNSDMDGDGHVSEACDGDDCDDSDGSVFPGADEICDPLGKNEDCAIATVGPPGPTGISGDADGDGFVGAMCCQRQDDGSIACGNDCNDANSEINPDASEICNGVDDNCDRMLDPVLEDRDGDGWAGCADLPADLRDCDDASAVTHPSAAELCDGQDNDCDGTAAGEDLDGDMFLASDASCAGGPRDAYPRSDCDDSSAGISPAAVELCDAIDQDCDGPVDEAPAAASCPSDAATTYACTSATCTIASCGSGYDDCDGLDTTGCEQALNMRDHCGACGTTCEWTCGAGATCDDPVAVTTGAYHACSRTSQGRIRCWGRNDDGQVGLGSLSTTPETRPAGYVQAFTTAGVVPLTTVQEVEAGATFNCARVASGNLYCWGKNDHGQLGDGVAGTSDGLARTHISNVDSFAIGETHGCAIRSGGSIPSGSVWCWGDDRNGQTGQGSLASATSLYQAWGSTPATDVVAGTDHNCLLTSLGTVFCWGSNAQGQLGDPAIVDVHPFPLQVRNEAGTGYLAGVVEIRASSNYTCARLSSGRVLCWGAGATRPNAVVEDSVSSPTEVRFTRFVGTENTSDQEVCGLPSGGRVQCVRVNISGGHYFDVLNSVAGTFVDTASHATDDGTSAIGCALLDTGLQCVGTNSYGEAGVGTRSPVARLTAVLPPSP